MRIPILLCSCNTPMHLFLGNQQRCEHTKMFTAALFIIQKNWKKMKINGRLIKLWFMLFDDHNQVSEDYLITKRNIHFHIVMWEKQDKIVSREQLQILNRYRDNWEYTKVETVANFYFLPLAFLYFPKFSSVTIHLYSWNYILCGQKISRFFFQLLSSTLW